MIDIHCHLLPGIDDGSRNLEESLDMARMAVADGITHAIVTPHIHPGRWENTAAIIADQTALFRQSLRDEQIPLAIGFAAEVRLSDQIFDQLNKQQLPFLGQMDGFNILLLEFPHSHIIPGSEKLVDWLLRQGIRPLIAHPERNKEIMANPEILAPFLQLGCLTQVTSGSLTGRFGEKAQRAALYFLDNNQIDFIATDAHNLTARCPAMAEAAALITRRMGAEMAQKLVYDRALKLTSSQFDDNSD